MTVRPCCCINGKDHMLWGGVAVEDRVVAQRAVAGKNSTQLLAPR